MSWNSNDILTPKGELLRDKALKDFNVNNYAIEVEEIGKNFANYLTRKAGPNNKSYRLQISLVDMMDSRYGSCTFGFPKFMAVPCKHMVAVLKSGLLEGLNENNIMLVWWMTTFFKRQFPLDVNLGGKMDIDWLKSRGQSDPNLYRCPSLAAPQKKERPKKHTRIKGALEGGKKRKRG